MTVDEVNELINRRNVNHPVNHADDPEEINDNNINNHMNTRKDVIKKKKKKRNQMRKQKRSQLINDLSANDITKPLSQISVAQPLQKKKKKEDKHQLHNNDYKLVVDQYHQHIFYCFFISFIYISMGTSMGSIP